MAKIQEPLEQIIKQHLNRALYAPISSNYSVQQEGGELSYAES